MKKCGIYKILNLINNKIYIGQSVDICYRWKQHKKSNSKNKYHNIYLDRAIHKYGIENFPI
jgi:group I intron endonuclease